MCKICPFRNEKPTQRQTFYVSGRSRYMYTYDRIECKVSHGSCGPSTKAPWFRGSYVWSCVPTISTITSHKSLSSSQWGHFHVFFDTIYRTRRFSNLCLKPLSNAHFEIFVQSCLLILRDVMHCIREAILATSFLNPS